MKEIRLDYADVKFPPSNRVVKQLSSELNKVNLYPRKIYLKLKQKLADYCNVSPDNILLTNGSDEAIDLITNAYGKTVLVPAPTFSEYERAALRNKCNINKVNCLKGKDYSTNFSDNDLAKSNLVWICNPNNPTGTTIPEKTIDYILKRSVGYVAVDECYYEFSKKTVIPLLKEFQNLIIIRSMSKGFGLAGLRLGYIIADKRIINELEQRKQIFSVNRIAAKAGLLVLEDLQYYKNSINNLIENREEFKKDLTILGINVFESDTNFVFICFKDKYTVEKIYSCLKSRRVFVFPAWDSEFSGPAGFSLRIAIGGIEDLKIIAKYLKEVLDK